ncbi:MAG: hypothetical protein NVSMB51_00700 [Solirubrobacteraceae bacterium]
MDADPDWLGSCRQITTQVQAMLAAHPTTLERAVETGRGEGGDQALVIDRAAEEIVFAELERLHAAGHRFSAVSEERGVVDFGSEALQVAIDPIDGSMNAKRGLAHHAISIAVADGPAMSDASFGFVFDFGTREEWSARRGGGAWLDGARVHAPQAERRVADGQLELVAIESAHPHWVIDCGPRLQESCHRLRVLGSIALGMCQVAAGRVDGFVTLWRCRSVDAAAAQLIVRESGGLVAFPAFADPLGAPLDLVAHSPVVAARTATALAELARVPSSQG